MSQRSIGECLEVINARLNGRGVVLVGMMGVGKTTVGRRLAARLKLPFLDADAEIERAAGKSVTEIFEDDGEAFFRDREEKVIARLLREQGPLVLATGGGAWMSPATRDVVAASAISVWLRADLDLLMKRVMRRPGRPLLQTGDPRAVMARLIEQRHPVYAKADITVDSRDVAHQVIVNDVIRALSAWLERHETIS